MENNGCATTLNDAFNKEILMLLRFLLEGTGIPNSSSELESPISLDEIAGSSHWLKRTGSGHVGEVGTFDPTDCASEEFA